MKYKRNVVSNLIVNILTIGIGFVTSVLIARGLGAYNQGQFAYYLLVFGLIGTYGHIGIVNANSYFIKKTNYNKNDIISTNINTLFILSGIYVLSTIILKNLILNSITLLLFIFWNVYAIIIIFHNFFLTMYVAEERIYIYNRYNTMTTIIKAVTIIVLFYANKLNINSLTLTYLISEVLKLLLMLKNLKYKYEFKINGSILKEEFKYGVPLYFGGLFIYLNYKADQIMIKNQLGNIQLGIYTIAVHLAELAFIFPEAIKSAFEGQLYSCKKEERKKVCAQTVKLTFYATLIICLIGCACKPLVRVLYGEEYIQAGNVMVILLLSIAIASIGKIVPTYFSTEGKSKIHLVVSAMVLLTNIIMNAILIPKIGILGAAIASTISYTFYGGLYLILLNRSGIKIKDMLFIQKSDIITIKKEIKKIIEKVKRENVQN